MGATFPFMMAYVRDRGGAAAAAGSFSFLYLANVMGAMTGTLLTAVVLIELLGFHHTLWVAAAGNVTIAVAATVLGLRAGRSAGNAGAPQPLDVAISDGPAGTLGPSGRWSGRSLMVVLFTTGFASMAMEVVWTRAFAAVLKTQVYSFALIVFTYLGATAAGAFTYRRHLARGRTWRRTTILFWLAVAALLPAVVNDPTFMVQDFKRAVMDPRSTALLLASICPLCGLLGYLTPWLIDDYAGGHPRRAGAAYAVNAVGCILGPLVAAYGLMPLVSGRWALIVLSAPFVAFWATAAATDGQLSPGRRVRGALAMAAAVAYAAFISHDFEEDVVRHAASGHVRRDAIASVACFGRGRRDKWLLVNGFGMTQMGPITKFITHLPLALHRGRPRSALVVCFGMGTSYRSALSWGVDTTAVELVPSVPLEFGFFFPDAARCLADPNGHIVIDDGRRYLSRCGRRFDAIVVDPPPPIEAAGCSLLLSTEFYALARQHLNPGGLVQMWYPGEATPTARAVLRSMVASFPYVRAFGSIEGWGTHLIGSMQPIPDLTPEQMVAAMPPAARADLVEWADTGDAAAYLGRVIGREVDVPRSLNPDPSVRVTDDRPFNEYFLLRRGLTSIDAEQQK